MPEVLVLTGNCGVGKSTIARAWADTRGGAAIHADDMHLWIRRREVRRACNYQEVLKADTALTATLNLLDQKLDVALDNVWFPATLERFATVLGNRTEVRMVRLHCHREVNRARDAARPIGRMGDRVDTLADELEQQNWPSFVAFLDSTGLTVDQTLARIAAVSAVRQTL